MNHSEDTPPDSRTGFLSELRRRKVVRAGLAYLAAAWLLLQVVDVVSPMLEVPDWTVRLILLLLAAGFPLVVFVAWAFELTPEGVKTTGRAREEFGEAQHETAIQRRRNLLAYATGAAGAALLIGVSFAAGILWNQWRPTTDQVEALDLADDVPTIAVLPFENMSPAEENAFFADGVHEEILTQLSRLPDVDVISRTSVKRISEDLPSLPEVARMLNATHIVEGSVRRAGNTVRITAQLIEASSDKHLWAENYDRDLQNVFAIQTDVALQIASALQSAFAPASLAEVEASGTASLEAYELFLKARQPGHRPRGGYGDEDRRAQVVDYLRQALEIDPDYAAAWQLLVQAEVWMPHVGADPDGVHLQAAEFALDQSRRLSPNSADTMLAEGYFLYQGKKQYGAALERISAARAIEPRRADLMALQAFVFRRLGKLEEAVDLLDQASRLDPLNAGLAIQLGRTNHWLGRNEAALRAYTRAYHATPEPGLWARYRLDLARLWASPTCEAWRDLHEWLLEEVRGSSEQAKSFGGWWSGLVEYLSLSGQREEIWPFFGREGGRVPMESEAIHAAYWETAALAFRGDEEAARELAEETLAASLEWYGDPENVAVAGDYLRIHGALHKAWLGGFLGRDELAAEGLAVLEKELAESKDALDRLWDVLGFVEGLLVSDPERAQEIYTGNASTINPTQIAMRPHFFARLLDSAEVRAQFDDKPELVQFMRDCWPESRPFPFD
jgi:TolB-like protein